MNPLPKEISTFKQAVAWFLQRPDYVAPKVTVTASLYQATSTLYPKQEAFAEVSGGVCQGMALEWIKANTRAGGAKKFRDQAASDWDPFAKSQLTVKHFKRRMRAQQTRLDRERNLVVAELNTVTADRDYSRETGVIAGIQHFFSPPKTLNQISHDINKVGGALKELETKQLAMAKRDSKIYPDTVFGASDSHTKFAAVGDSVALASVGAALQGDQGKHPGYYLVNMSPDSADSGHCIAVHAAYRPRLLDANSCEFQFDSMVTLYAFLTDYWQIYNRAGYAKSKVRLYRFDIRLAAGPNASKILEFAERMSVHEQLLQTRPQIG